MKNRKVELIIKYLAITFACGIYGLGFNLFLSPYDIVPGGASGAAMIINRLLGAPSVGVLILIINVPLFVLAYIKLGRRFVIGTVYGTVVLSLMVDLFSFVPGVETEPLLAALYGGLSSGAGLGIVFYFGSTTGGVDIVAALIRKRRPNAKMGRIILVIDAAIAVCAAVVFKSLSSAMYAVVVFYVSSIVSDAILYGSEDARIAYIISDKYQEISKAVEKQLVRGVTFIHGTGAYTGTEKNVILCAVKRRQVGQMKKLVKAIDPDAFFIICAATEVLGNGFSPNV